MITVEQELTLIRQEMLKEANYDFHTLCENVRKNSDKFLKKTK